MQSIQLLNQNQVGSKIKRMCYQIWEHNAHVSNLHIVGVNKGGERLAAIIHKELMKIADLSLTLNNINIQYINDNVNIAFKNEMDYTNQNVIIIDDVANTGKTLLHAIQPIFNSNPASIQLAVLVNRKHKAYPINPDIIGHEVSTTIQDNIEVNIDSDNKISVFLQ